MKIFLLVVGFIAFYGKATAQSSAEDEYVLVDGKRISESIIEEKPEATLSRQSQSQCWKIKVIIYYEDDFLVDWVGAGSIPVIPRIHNIMDLVKDGIFDYYGLDVQFDFEAIDYWSPIYNGANGNYDASYYGILRSSVVDWVHARTPDAWIFLSYDGNTGGLVGSAGGAFCSNDVPVIVTEARDFTGGNSDLAWIDFLRYFFGTRIQTSINDPETCLEECCVPCRDWNANSCNQWKLNGHCGNSMIRILCCLTCQVY